MHENKQKSLSAAASVKLMCFQQTFKALTIIHQTSNDAGSVFQLPSTQTGHSKQPVTQLSFGQGHDTRHVSVLEDRSRRLIYLAPAGIPRMDTVT